MELTVYYEVEVIERKVVISEASCGVEVNDEQLERLQRSFRSGKYRYIEEDSTLKDIFDAVYREALEIEKQMEYGEYVGTEIVPIRFNYPCELCETIGRN